MEALDNQTRILDKLTKIFEGARSDILVYANAYASIVTTNNELIQAPKRAARKRGVKLRYITEFTRENLPYCKKQMGMVDELRHLNGIKGNFILSDHEFLVFPEISKEYPLTNGTYSNYDNILKQYWYMFETLWNSAMPAQERIRELETDKKNSGQRQDILDGAKVGNKVIDRFYLCQQCGSVFVYMEDVQEHGIATGHKKIKEYPL